MSAAAEITWIDHNTVQIRQPKASHWEAPFLYLLFGTERALLLDTGASRTETEFALRGTVDALIARWLSENPGSQTQSYELIAAHTHSHGDHIAGDPLLAEREHTTVVGTAVDEVIAFYGFTAWPDEVVTLELGERPIEVIGGPGHEAAAAVFFDRATGILFTGDTVCVGNLYVRDRTAFTATIERLIRFRDAAPTAIRVLLGAHVEMTSTPGIAYPSGSIEQPDEAELALPPSILDEVRAALDEPGTRVVRDRFILVDE